MAQLDAALENALALWRADLAHVRSGEAVRQPHHAVEARRIAVVVHHETTLAALRAAGLDAGHDDAGHVSGIIALADMERLAATGGVISVTAQPEVRIALDTSLVAMQVPWKVPAVSTWPGRGSGAIVAVIDTGIDIFHDSFRKADHSTRILELWDQAAETGGALPPADYPQTLGRVFNQAAINAALTAGGSFASEDKNGHGTHVAGIAAGNGLQDDRCAKPGSYVGVAPEADLIIVRAIDLPADKSSSIADALRWCATAPARLGVDKPVVINGSFSSDVGPHDGHGPLDGMVDRLLRPSSGILQKGLAVVVAAGNAGGLETRETGTVAANGTATLPFYIPDGATLPCDIDIWFNGSADLSIEVVAPPNPGVPGSNSSGVIAPATPGSPFAIGRMNVAITFNGPSAINGNMRNIRITIALGATATENMNIRPGNWEMRFTETAGTAAVWNAWCASKHGDGFPTFRMPGDPDITPRRRVNVIGEPGSSVNAITIASYNDDGGALSDFSSRGPESVPAGTPVDERKPTLAAPGVGIRSAKSGQSGGAAPSSCCDQKVVDLQGTSMASPHVAGLVALIFEKNRTLNFEQVRAHLQHSAQIDGIDAADQPPIVDVPMNIRHNHLWGSGKANAAIALAEIPAAPGDDDDEGGGSGGGGTGGGTITMDDIDWGYTPHNFASRLSEWKNRHGPRPGLMLLASLISEHVDEILRLINQDRRVGAVWQREGGPRLIRHLLQSPAQGNLIVPQSVRGCDVPHLLERFIPALLQRGGERLRADILRYGGFARIWPGATLARLDEAALAMGDGA